MGKKKRGRRHGSFVGTRDGIGVVDTGAGAAVSAGGVVVEGDSGGPRALEAVSREVKGLHH